MKLTIFLGIVLGIVAFFASLVVLNYLLKVAERVEQRTKTWIPKMLVYLVGGILSVGIYAFVGVGIFNSPEVISVKGRHYEHTSWLFLYRADGHLYRVRHGMMYLYNADETDTTLVIRPVYYHSNPDSLGRKVINPLPTERLLPGFQELKHPPMYVFQRPDNVFDDAIGSDEKILYHLGRLGEDEVPDYYLKLNHDPVEVYELLDGA